MLKIKRWSRRSLVLILLLLVSVLASACTPGNDSTDQAGPGEEKDTISITDCMGRQVEVPANAENIACMYAFSGHVTTMLDRGQDVVATNKGLTRDVLLNMICPGIGDNLVPFTHGSINIEELLKAEPDLVFVKGDVGRNEAEVEKLDKFKIPYLVIDFKSIEEQKYAIEVIGEALGAADKAQRYNEYYQDCIDRVQAVVSKIPEEERVRLYHSVNEATRTDAADTLAADWTEKTGVINVSVGKELRMVEDDNFASLEQILLWDPDVIIANEAGVGKYILNNKQWAPLKAVKDQKVYQMPIGISRWGHPGGMETPLGILWTAKTIYPEYFPDLDMESETRSFFKEFFNYELSDEMLGQILNGEAMRVPKNEKQD